MAPRQRAALSNGSQSGDVQATTADHSRGSSSASKHGAKSTPDHTTDAVAKIQAFVNSTWDSLMTLDIPGVLSSSFPPLVAQQQVDNIKTGLQVIQIGLDGHASSQISDTQRLTLGHRATTCSSPTPLQQAVLPDASTTLQAHLGDLSQDDSKFVSAPTSPVRDQTTASVDDMDLVERQASPASVASSATLSAHPPEASGTTSTAHIPSPAARSVDQWLEYIEADEDSNPIKEEPCSSEPAYGDPSDGESALDSEAEYTSDSQCSESASDAEEAALQAARDVNESQYLSDLEWTGDQAYDTDSAHSDDEDEADTVLKEESDSGDDLDLPSVHSTPLASTRSKTVAASSNQETTSKKRSAPDQLSGTEKRAKTNEYTMIHPTRRDHGSDVGMPPGWVAYCNSETGEMYYVDHNRRKTTSKKPKC